MATDGDIDFTTYTREQLDSAVARMDHARYPINSAKLIDEYQRRKVAEKKAAVLAIESATPVVPDSMLSVAKTFDVTFEPSSSFFNWLGPSRNDFHLIGAGTIHVDDVLIRVKGRRYSYWIGISIVDTDELGRQYVMNVEVQGRAVRFELRVPGEKVRGITVWLKTTEGAEQLFQLLPSERTPDFTPQLQQHVQFEESLIAQSPKIPVTYGLIILCVCVYVTAALGTRHLSLDGPSLVRLGSNFGPYTTSGDWWRLLTSLFLHAGILHLAFNMWALASFGPVVERLYGSVSYALLYFVAGVAGSLASISLNPAINSVGASGAIFGLLGALIAAQLRSAASFPPSVLRPLRRSSLIFTGYALLAGLLSTGVDNAAHLGGVVTGFLLGLLLSRPVTGLRLSTGDFLQRFGLAAVASIFVLGTVVAAARSATTRLTGEGLYAATVHWFTPGEIAALQRWRELGALADADKLDDDTYAERIEREVVPFWREADLRLKKIELPKTSSDYESLLLLRSVATGRLRAYQLAQQGLRQHDSDLADRAADDLQRIDESVRKRAKDNAEER
jgi:rhomboid protease GluP